LFLEGGYLRENLGDRKSEREQAFSIERDDYNEVGRQGCGEYIERRENGGWVG